MNRPVVVRRPDGYHMWYTGQTAESSAIGHAVSDDGLLWTRTSEQPVLVPDQPWEGVAVMAPHVLWDDDDHSYDYVITMLKVLFGHTEQKGFKLAEEVDNSGRVICLTTTMEHAELKRDQIHAYGKDDLIASSGNEEIA